MRLKENFFDSDEMKIIESESKGIEYQNLYLKLCLLSIKTEGRLVFKDFIPYDNDMLSTILRVNIETLNTGMELFKKLALIEVLETGIIYITDIQNHIGHTSSEAERVKKYRERMRDEKAGKVVQMYENRTPEINIETEL